MRIFQILINLVQIVLIFFWTAFCATLGIVLMLFLWNGSKVHYITGYYFYSPLIMAICGVKVRVCGMHHLRPEIAHVFVSNHASHLDVVAIARVIPLGLFFIAKKELAKVPFLGQYMAFIGHIFVDRKNREKAAESLRMAADKIRNGRNVISFPEGTRTKTGELMLFKRGSFIIAKEGKIPIQPIAVIGSREILPSGGWMIRGGVIKISIGPAIEADAFENWSVEELSEEARKRVHHLISEK
jgi:1-acyl-sn-glycerol-3-phosphate acyltransferase